MVNKYSRAQRRHDRARLKVKRQYHWGYGHKSDWGRDIADIADGKINYMSPEVAGGIVDTPTPCSCWMCINPRRGTGIDKVLTMQERKAFANSIDQLRDIK